jgi:hypothetical protein
MQDARHEARVSFGASAPGPCLLVPTCGVADACHAFRPNALADAPLTHCTPESEKSGIQSTLELPV